MTEVNTDQQKFQFFYQRLVGDIENTKRRQWLIPYYILLLFAAIIGFVSLSGLPKEAICVTKILLTVLALVIAIAGVWHIIDTHLTQVKYRRQIYKLETSNLHFTYGFLRFDKKSLHAGYYLKSFTVFFSLVVLVGLFCVLIFLGIPWRYSLLIAAACVVIGWLVYRNEAINLEEDFPIP
jgi:hypothetical protein